MWREVFAEKLFDHHGAGDRCLYDVYVGVIGIHGGVSLDRVDHVYFAKYAIKMYLPSFSE